MTSQSRTLVNGSQAHAIGVYDRGLAFGDGVFETIAVREGQPLLWALHMDRLQTGCRLLGIEPVPVDGLVDDAGVLCSGLRQAVLKLTVTRGAGARGYAVDDVGLPNRIAAVYPWPEFPPERATHGVRVGVCEVRLARQPRLAGIKSLNRLEQVLARQEWQRDWDEALMLDADDNIVEGTASNLFLVCDGALVTPELSECGVAGVMRRHVLRCAGDRGISCRVERVEPGRLAQATEVFLTSSLIGIWPVTRLVDRQYEIGPVTRQLQQAIAAAVAYRMDAGDTADTRGG